MQRTKLCPTCATKKSINEFGRNRSRRDCLQSQCRACKRTVQKNWYEANKASHVAKVVKRRREVEAEMIGSIVAYLKTHPCVDCGESNPVVLEFDHVRGNKINAIC